MHPIPLHAPAGTDDNIAARTAAIPDEVAREAPAGAAPPVFRAAPSAPHPSPWRYLRRYRAFLAIVIAPTLLLSALLYMVIADQYQSEARFIVRSAQQSGGNAGGLGQLLGLSANSTAADNHSIIEYLLSQNAVDAVSRDLDLVAMFRRSEADPFSRLSADHPRREELLRFYRDMVHISYSPESGITALTVRGFRPADAQALANALLALGEGRVNSFNQRALGDGLTAARAQLRDAETEVARLQAQVTGFRQGRRDADPERTATAQISQLSQLQGQAAQARAQLDGMQAAIGRSSPQVLALARQVGALEAQVAAAQTRLAGGSRSVASDLGSYEGLKLRQEFAAKRYEAAAAALETARDQALRQQLYVVRVVEPSVPEKPLYPKRLKTIATVFAALMLAYGIGWLILAGVREHVA